MKVILDGDLLSILKLKRLSLSYCSSKSESLGGFWGPQELDATVR